MPNIDKKNLVSIVVPTLNESGNIEKLVERIDRALGLAGIQYEIIFVDDHSSDKTQEEITALIPDYPIEMYKKKGKRDKAESIVEGFRYAKGEYIGYIDADMQYPPEAFPRMVKKMEEGYDLVNTKRVKDSTSLLRKILHFGFSLFFTRLLHGFDLDVQSGLKLFRSELIKDVNINPSGWAFELELLLKARNYGYRFSEVDIDFDNRLNGESKINIKNQVFEIGLNAVKLKLKKAKPLVIQPDEDNLMLGAGVAHNKKRFITHTTLEGNSSAIHTIIGWQKLLLFLLVSLVIFGLYFSPLATGVSIIAILSLFYFVDMFFNLFLVSRSLRKPAEIQSTDKELEELDKKELPIYSILCPLYKEANILGHFLDGISQLDWPKESLDVMLLLEEDDRETIETAEAMNLPEYVRVVIVPHSFPKTKPKACNYGLCQAKGEYVVIYDAEDTPDPKQLKKAYLGFIKSGDKVRCLQAKLNYYNAEQNILTRLFTAEYSLWFDVILPGLQSISTSIPLGGTSNHFRTKDLLDLEGWDPFNVTEDCDLGVRIFKKGFQTAIIDSVTYEEANCRVGNWLRQRSRWIKGYMQTYLVHMRDPISFLKENGIHALIFQLVVGGKVAVMIINPLLWVTTILYFALNAWAGPAIEELFPAGIFYIAVMAAIFGNFLYIYYYMIGCAQRSHWSIIKYVFFIPVYWAMVSIAATKAAYQLIVKPYYWEKTHHG